MPPSSAPPPPVKKGPGPTPVDRYAAAAAVLDPQGLAWNTFGLGPLVIDAARRDLGFSPATSIADGAAATRNWVIERGTS